MTFQRNSFVLQLVTLCTWSEWVGNSVPRPSAFRGGGGRRVLATKCIALFMDGPYRLEAGRDAAFSSFTCRYLATLQSPSAPGAGGGRRKGEGGRLYQTAGRRNFGGTKIWDLAIGYFVGDSGEKLGLFGQQSRKLAIFFNLVAM